MGKRIGRLTYPASDRAAVVAHGIRYLVGGGRNAPLAAVADISVR